MVSKVSQHGGVKRRRRAYDELAEHVVGELRRLHRERRKATREKQLLLERIYTEILEWMERNKSATYAKALRREVRIADGSSLFLAFLRFACNEEEFQKTASDWAAAMEYAHSCRVRPEDFRLFLIDEGGIVACRRKMAKVRRGEPV